MQLRIPERQSGLRRGRAPVPTEQPVAVLGQLALGHLAGQLRDGLLIVTRDRPGDAESRSDDDVRHARLRAPVRLACQKTEPTVARRAVLMHRSESALGDEDGKLRRLARRGAVANGNPGDRRSHRHRAFGATGHARVNGPGRQREAVKYAGGREHPLSFVRHALAPRPRPRRGVKKHASGQGGSLRWPSPRLWQSWYTSSSTLEQWFSGAAGAARRTRTTSGAR